MTMGCPLMDPPLGVLPNFPWKLYITATEVSTRRKAQGELLRFCMAV